MNAIIFEQYGVPSEVLKKGTVDKPTIDADEVLIEVHAVGLNAADKLTVRGEPFVYRFVVGFPKPKMNIVGADVAGKIVAVGSDVTQFKVGDRVFGDLSASRFGGLAQFAKSPANILAHVPDDMTFEQAAALPMAGLTALQALRDHGKLKAGQKVLIHGASGGVGSFAVQIAKALGAEVTAVCSTRNVEQARSLGADHVIDYKQEDFLQNGEQYDLIVLANGDRPMRDYKKALTSDGTCIAIGGAMKQIFSAMLGPLHTLGSQKTIKGMMARINSADLNTLTDLFINDKLTAPIEKCYPFNDAIDAMAHLNTGRARGKIVVSMTA